MLLSAQDVRSAKTEKNSKLSKHLSSLVDESSVGLNLTQRMLSGITEKFNTEGNPIKALSLIKE